jgi:phosphodiesterase/alkaline phosphatase D-like protein
LASSRASHPWLSCRQSPFTHGVASGDVTPFSAVLWTRVNQPGAVTAEVAREPTFTKVVFKAVVRARVEDDFTVKDSVSAVGTFKTPPLPTVSASVRFAYTGDSDRTKVEGQAFFNTFEALDAASREDVDFFVYLGDTIYADSSLRATGPAITLDDYRDAYRLNRKYANPRNLLKATSTYVIWDDHEVVDDFDGQTIDPARYANGRQAFLEYMPVAQAFPLQDPDCAGNPLFRIFRWGKEVELIILDERSCRSASVEPACVFAPGVLDLAPTLPPPLRAQFGLPSSPSPGCLDAIFDPARTLLGSVQKAAFLGVLRHSTARFKVIVNEVPIQQFYVLPYDRWEGYGFERAEILGFMRAHNIRNVILLTTDSHANMIYEVFLDRFLEPQPMAQEFMAGPIAAFTLEHDIVQAMGPDALTAFHALLTLVGVECRHLNSHSYGLVDVDSSAGTATITLKDAHGDVVHDQLNPAISCTKTLGP